MAFLFFVSQVKFDSEVVQVYNEQKCTYETLKGNVSLLSDTNAAQETFKKFEAAAGIIERLSFDLLKVVTTAASYFFDVVPRVCMCVCVCVCAVTSRSCRMW